MRIFHSFSPHSMAFPTKKWKRKKQTKLNIAKIMAIDFCILQYRLGGCFFWKGPSNSVKANIPWCKWRLLPVEQRQGRHWLGSGTFCGSAGPDGRQLTQELMKLGGKEAAQGLEAVGLYQTHGHRCFPTDRGNGCGRCQRSSKNVGNRVFMDKIW